MFRSLTCLVVVALVIPPGRAVGQEGPPLTLGAALEEAVARNPALAVLRSEAAVARERPAQARFLEPPMISAQLWQWPIRAFGPMDSSMVMFMTTQPLPGRGKRDLRVAVALAEADVSENAVRVRALDLLDDVKRTYAGLYLARKAVAVYDGHLAVLRQLADASTSKYVAGRSPQQDVLKAVTEISSLHEERVTLDEQVRLAEARLNSLLDRAPGAPVGALSEPREFLALPSVGAVQARAARSHPALVQARLETERAGTRLAAVRAERRPDFSVTGGYMMMPRDRDAWTASVGISWPTAPWARGSLDARIAEASAAVEAARAREREMANVLGLAVQLAYVRVQAAQQRAALLRSSVVPQSEQTLEVSRVAYQADRVDFLVLLDNQRSLLDAELGYYRALSQIEEGLAALERAAGGNVLAAATAPPAPVTEGSEP
jgi:outer membrane protein TolC